VTDRTWLPAITRRQFLVASGAGAGAVLLGACGGTDEAAEPTTTAALGELSLAQFFGGPVFVAGQEARAPFGVADLDGLLPIERSPASLAITLVGPDGNDIGDPIEVERRSEGLPRAYFPLRFTVDEPGFYTARTELDGVGAEMAIQVEAAEDVVVIQPGATLPAIATPTLADAQGVDPICTAQPTCALHDVSLDAALTNGRPIALLVSTPLFCQVAICGPVLDVLLGQMAANPDVQFIHTEVYAHPQTDPQLQDYAPTVAALGLHFEPCLVLARGDGKVTERLDDIFDGSELAEALARLR
jgi:TAT (twin-arginine translocation) pathway signal sequence